MSKLTLCVLLFLFGQTLIWFQTNGQFINEWAKKNPLILSIIGGTVEAAQPMQSLNERFTIIFNERLSTLFQTLF